jgi:hypothetical protein
LSFKGRSLYLCMFICFVLLSSITEKIRSWIFSHFYPMGTNDLCWPSEYTTTLLLIRSKTMTHVRHFESFMIVAWTKSSFSNYQAVIQTSLYLRFIFFHTSIQWELMIYVGLQNIHLYVNIHFVPWEYHCWFRLDCPLGFLYPLFTVLCIPFTIIYSTNYKI